MSKNGSYKRGSIGYEEHLKPIWDYKFTDGETIGCKYLNRDKSIEKNNIPKPRKGCIDPNACNRDPNANIDDGSCKYPKEGYDCDGNSAYDPQTQRKEGCMDPDACNYDSSATDDDGSCDIEDYEDCEICKKGKIIEDPKRFKVCLDKDKDGVCDNGELSEICSVRFKGKKGKQEGH